MRHVRIAGFAGLGTTGGAVAVMAAIALLGPSTAVPDLGGGAPPWSFHAAPGGGTVIVLGWLAVIMGAAGVGVALYALRRGWRPPIGGLLGGVVAAVALLAVVPPAGSTDVLNYAIYGRIAALGHDPYVTTPAWLHEIGDPVGRMAPLAWRDTPSVYGPLATWAQFACARLGGASMAGIVFTLKLATALAFLLSALVLDRLARADRERRIRVHLLWSLNPLMLWHVVLGGHVDGLGVALLLAALLALRRGGVAAGLLAGALLGAAAAVKAPFILAGAGLAWAARRSWATLTALVMGVSAALVGAYATQGPEAIDNLAGKLGARSMADPWRLVVEFLAPGTTGPGAPDSPLEGRLALGAALLIALLLFWRLPEGPADVASARPALALCLGWLLTSPVQHPWYDAMLFPLLALMPAGRLDGPVLARGVVTSLIYLPGAVGLSRIPGPQAQWIAEVYRPWAAPLAEDLLIVAVVALGLAGALRARPLRR
ncbi:polyprenol phosphomannose-dependent alpha 1,6 mannosyltransferase MptB [Sphaerisporangium sp. NPDC051017]|uniref:polyprenol phosphomannose-dependent alpha 1,6 mannosyltransferase MptB n=1 Tax=Sphaerisporangium sp. NPDC051017 TaxID=3154636 RepID=UPI00342765DF